MNRSNRGTLVTRLLLLAALLPVAALKAQPAPAKEEPTATTAGQAQPARDGSTSEPATPTPPAPGRGTGRPAFAGQRPGGRPGFGGPPAPTLGDGPTCTLDATVYDVRLPVDQIGRLDLDALTNASDTAEAFEKALAALGTTKPLYRANQSVRLFGDVISIVSEVPVVTNARLTATGQTINTVRYQDTGAIFTLAGKAGPTDGAVDLDLGIEISAASDSGAAIGDKVTAPIMRRARLSRKGPLRPDKPFAVVSVDAASADKDGKAVAYIARITLGKPQPPAAK